MKISLFVFAMFVLEAACYSATLNSTYKIALTDLGAGVKPVAINNNGVVVGQASNGQAFRWDQGSMTVLGTLGGSQSFAHDINDNGTIVGWSFDSTESRKSFKWNGAFTNLDGATTLQGAALAINNNDSIVGWRTNGTIFRSTLWTDSDLNGFSMFGGGSHKALGINDEGDIVGMTVNSAGEGEGGFYWNSTDSTGSYTHGLDQFYLPIAGINNAGITAGINTNTAGYMHFENIFSTTISKISVTDPSSSALGQNNAGLIVGESGMKGFIYDLTTNTLYNSNDFDFVGNTFDSILKITDVNNNGTFVGVAQVGGVEHGFSGRFVIPEPSAKTLAALAAAGVVIWMIIAKSRQQVVGC